MENLVEPLKRETMSVNKYFASALSWSRNCNCFSLQSSVVGHGGSFSMSSAQLGELRFAK